MTDAHSFEFIELTYPSEGVALITFNRPKVRSLTSMDRIREAHASSKPKVTQVLIVTGAGGRAFVSGADIANSEIEEALAAARTRSSATLSSASSSNHRRHRGICLERRMRVAIACDLRVAGHSAKLGQPETSLGIITQQAGLGVFHASSASRRRRNSSSLRPSSALRKLNVSASLTKSCVTARSLELPSRWRSGSPPRAPWRCASRRLRFRPVERVPSTPGQCLRH